MPFGDGATHHDYHHAKVKGNYAGFFPWWDAAFVVSSGSLFVDHWLFGGDATGPHIMALLLHALAAFALFRWLTAMAVSSWLATRDPVMRWLP